MATSKTSLYVSLGLKQALDVQKSALLTAFRVSSAIRIKICAVKQHVLFAHLASSSQYFGNSIVQASLQYQAARAADAAALFLTPSRGTSDGGLVGCFSCAPTWDSCGPTGAFSGALEGPYEAGGSLSDSKRRSAGICTTPGPSSALFTRNFTAIVRNWI